jgi:hypothetical protein
MLESAAALDQPQLALSGLELELDLSKEHRSRPVENPRPLAEHPLHRGDELGAWVLEALHRSRSGT